MKILSFIMIFVMSCFNQDSDNPIIKLTDKVFESEIKLKLGSLDVVNVNVTDTVYTVDVIKKYRLQRYHYFLDAYNADRRIHRATKNGAFYKFAQHDLKEIKQYNEGTDSLNYVIMKTPPTQVDRYVVTYNFNVKNNNGVISPGKVIIVYLPGLNKCQVDRIDFKSL